MKAKKATTTPVIFEGKKFVRKKSISVRKKSLRNDEDVLDPTQFQVPDLTTYQKTSEQLISDEAEVLMIEWGLLYHDKTPRQYLIEIKKYANHRASRILNRVPTGEWRSRRSMMTDQVQKDLIHHHTDKIAQVQEQHVRASNIGLAKAISLISKMQVEVVRDSKGKPIYDGKTGKPVYKGFRSIDLLNCMNSIGKAQEIYRRAMGLPNDGEGLAQILDKLKPVTHNTQINIGGVESTPAKEALEELSYDEVMTFVEHKRKRLRAEQDDQVKPPE